MRQIVFKATRQFTVMCALLLWTFSTPARAETTILSVTGSAGSNAIGIFPTQWIAVSFTVDRPYVNVTISADLVGTFTGTAYLMTRVGPGTTAADEVASEPFVSAAPGGLSRIQPVLHVSLLPAGSYVVVLSTTQSTPPQGWATTTSATVVAAEGVVNGPSMSTFGTAGISYPPAARFFNFPTPGVAAEFLVTGTPYAIPVGIDIKPGDFPNSINLEASGTIPVAILSSETFDAPSEVDPATLVLAGSSVRVVGRGNRFQCSREDVNADSLTDLVCHFANELTAQAGDSRASLEGQTYSGLLIHGEDSIRIVAQK